MLINYTNFSTNVVFFYRNKFICICSIVKYHICDQDMARKNVFKNEVFGSDNMTPKKVIETLEKKEIKFVDLQFTDFPGRLHHTTIPLKRLDEEIFTEGAPQLDGSSVRGFVDINESDLMMKPDPTTLGLMSWTDDNVKAARLICDIYWGFEQGRLAWDPRAIAQNAEKELKNQGYDFAYFGPEVEFFVFNKVSWDVMNPHKGQGYSIESREAAWNQDTSEGYPIRFKEGYFPVPPHDTLMDFRGECAKSLEENFGVEVDAHHHEVATAGQCEIDINRNTLVRMADAVQSYKLVIKNMAAQQGLVSTIMPKPIFGDNGSGMHVSQSIWKDNKNMFYDPDETESELSQMSRYYIGGLLEHAQALTVITAPSTNSYKRLVPGYEAPVYIGWSRRNRSSCVRIPFYQKGSANSKRVEYRPPDPSANPYLCFAALLAAGLDGVKKKIDIGDPIDENVYTLSAKKRSSMGIKELPGSLKEAVEAFKSDNAFLKPIFPEEALERIVEIAEKDHMEVSMRPHPYEFYLYFDL